MRTIRKYHIDYYISAPRRPEQNPAEQAMGIIKSRWYRVMTKKKVPQRLWNYGLIWVCETSNMTVSSSKYANGRTSANIQNSDFTTG